MNHQDSIPSKVSRFLDGSEWEESDEIITIESALRYVYPDKKAVTLLLSNTKQDLSEVLRQLEERYGPPKNKE